MSTTSSGRGPAARRRRRPVLAVLVTLFAVVPLVELYVLIQVGQVIGGWSTIGLLLLSALLGGWLVRREGRRAWTALTTALQSGRMPARELTDAGLVLLGGVLMIAPGFLTDLVGVLLVLPLTRPVARRALSGTVTRRLLASSGGVWTPGSGPGRTNARHDVVTGEVLDEGPEDRPDRPR